MKWKMTKESQLDAPIAQVLERMEVADPEEPEYEKLCARLETLVKLRDGDSKAWWKNQAMITVLGNLAVTVLVIGYERHNVMTSKAWDKMVQTKS